MATQDVERRFSDSEHTAQEIERLRRLLEASSALLGSLSVEKVLPEVLDLARQTLAADGYALWQLDQDTNQWQIAIHSGLSEDYVEHAPGTVSARDTNVSFDAPIVAEEIADAEWLTPEHRRAHAAAGTQSMLAVALRHDERVFGTLAFYYGEPHHFTEAEKSAAWTLGNLAAVAIRTAELYEIQRRRADDRKFVADASEQLASSLDYETTLANVASLAVAGFSDWCAIDMLDESGSIKRLTVAHGNPDKASWANELLAEYPPDPDTPYGVANVIRTRLPELFSDIPEELLVDAAGDQPQLLTILRELGLKSTICVPLIARDRPFGAITFVSAESGRRYDGSDLATAQDLARSAAIAVDNALLFRAAEESRRQAQESLAVVDSVFAAAPIGLAFMDTNFCYVRVNDALARINGLPADEHYGRTLRDVLGDLADEIEPYHRQVIESGEPILDLNVIGETAGAPGQTRNWLVSYYPVRDGSNVTIGVGVVLTDVTEREQARAEAEAANDRLAVLADASQRLASTLDYETTLANLATLLVPRYADWYAVDVLDDSGGFKRLAVAHMDAAKDEWVAKALERYTADPEEPEGTGRAVRTGEALLYRTITDDFLASSTKDPEHHQVLHQLGMESAMVVPLTVGGRTYGALMLASADPERLYDEADLEFAQHLARRAAVAVDNARLYKSAEEQARASLVVAHVADGVLLVDRLGVIRLWNPAAEQITGLTREDALGRRAEDLFGSKEAIAPLPQGEATRPTTHQVDVNGRELWLSITGVGYGDGTVYAFRDLTAERAIEKLKSDFVSTISHELRTPLAAIYGAALTLRRDDVRLGEPQRDGLLEVIANESDRLARIVNDILWASRLESGGMHTTIEQCDGVAIASSVLDAARQYVPPNIELAFSAPDDAPPIAADADKARQVLTNLVDNAVKYSPDGGRVELEITVAGRGLRFAVRDQGLGIPPAEHRQIFEKFYRLDPNLTRGVGGTGLGLYISRELLERMGGRIWVESSGRGGSTFVAELPIAY